MVMKTFRNRLTFYGQIIRQNDEVGAFSATSRVVAEAVAEPIRSGTRPLRVLEVGAGTGAMTRWIAKRLGAQDRFDVCEINPVFVRVLREDYTSVPGGPEIHIHEGDIERWAPDAPYDVIVSSLPLLNMPPEKVDAVFAYFLRNLRPDGTLTYYDYWAKDVRRFVGPSRERRRMKAVLDVTKRYLDKHEYRRRVVVRNLPPACVHYLSPTPIR